jgi:NAD-dependent deacetylase
VRAGVDAGVERPAVGDRPAVAFDPVVEAEAGAAQVAAGTADRETVVEPRRAEVASVDLRRQRLYPLGAELGVPAAEARQVIDSGDLEPDEVGRVVRDALRVGLGETDPDFGGEVEVHAGTLRSEAVSVLELAELIRRRRPCVVLTGAGVSTESGIPDFRSPTGLWARFDPLEYGSLEAFRRDPHKVWNFYKPRIAMLTEAEPNPAHRALAELEQLGLVQALVTQNIDLLHERAGSREVVEVHGSIRTASCRGCGERYPLLRVLELLEDADAPACPSCGEILKPDVVFFGEVLPPEAIDRAFELARGARLLLVVGSALEVYPVAGLPLETVKAGGEVAIVNRGETAFDGRAGLRIEARAGELLPQVVDALRQPRA